MKFKATTPVVLASASPRRSELVGMLGIDFSVEPSLKEEPNPKEFKTAVDYVTACARLKAEDIAKSHPEAVVIGSDTVVVLGEVVLLKPKNKEQAGDYLRRLSGETHEVITAVSIVKDGNVQSFHERTRVTFYELPEEWIQAYTNTKDPYDKAGAYGIQTVSGLFVEKIDGDYNAVVGLPISRLARKLMESGWIRIVGGSVAC